MKKVKIHRFITVISYHRDFNPNFAFSSTEREIKTYGTNIHEIWHESDMYRNSRWSDSKAKFLCN